MRTSHSRTLILLVAMMVVGAALFVGACGGTDDTSTTTQAETVTTVTGPETTAASGTSAEATGGTSGNVAVKGLVDEPMTLTVAVLEGMTVTEITVDHPKLGMTDYRGVRFVDLFTAVGVQDSASTVAMIAADGYMVEVTLSDIEGSADAMLTIGDDGTLTVVIPGIESKSWVKDVVTIEFK